MGGAFDFVFVVVVVVVVVVIIIVVVTTRTTPLFLSDGGLHLLVFQALSSGGKCYTKS